MTANTLQRTLNWIRHTHYRVPPRRQFMTSSFLLASLAQSAPSGAEARAADLRAFRTEFLAKRQVLFGRRPDRKPRRGCKKLEARRGTHVAGDISTSSSRASWRSPTTGTPRITHSSRSRRYNRVPVRLVPFGEQFYVLHADSANASLVGAELIAIDGREIGQAIAAGRSFSGGTEPWRDRSVPYLLESPEQLHALHLAKQPGSATYRFVLPGGQRVERSLRRCCQPRRQSLAGAMALRPAESGLGLPRSGHAVPLARGSRAGGDGHRAAADPRCARPADPPFPRFDARRDRTPGTEEPGPRPPHERRR